MSPQVTKIQLNLRIDIQTYYKYIWLTYDPIDDHLSPDNPAGQPNLWLLTFAETIKFTSRPPDVESVEKMYNVRWVKQQFGVFNSTVWLEIF